MLHPQQHKGARNLYQHGPPTAASWVLLRREWPEGWCFVAAEGQRQRNPRKPEFALAAFPLFAPYPFPMALWCLPGGSRQDDGRFFKGGERRMPRATSRPLPCSERSFKWQGTIRATGWLRSHTQHLFAIAHDLDMGAEPGFQIADIYRPHAAIIANMTMLVMLFFTPAKVPSECAHSSRRSTWSRLFVAWPSAASIPMSNSRIMVAVCMFFF